MKQILYVLSFMLLFFGTVPPLLYRIWNTGVAVLLGAGLLLLGCLHYSRWLAGHARLWRLCIAGGSLVFVGVLVVSSTMLWYGWLNSPKGENLPVIVLGSKIVDDKPSRMLQRRLDKAADYLLQHPESICIVSGGQGADESFAEAFVMSTYLQEKGIAEIQILQEDASGNTRENIAFSKKLLASGESNVAIVTDGFHQMRAAIYAKKEGLTASALSSATPWGLFPSYWVREWFAIIQAALLRS